MGFSRRRDAGGGTPLADWSAHLSVVRDKAVPLPEQLTTLPVEMAEPLNATAADAPPASLRTAGHAAHRRGA